MEMREWLSIIVIIAIVLIVADGFRRKRKERNPVKMKLERNIPRADSGGEDEASAELPHGGARTIPRDLYHKEDSPSGKKVVRGKQQRKSKMERTLDFEEQVPVLMDSVAIQPEEIDGEETPASRFADAAGAAIAERGGQAFRNGRKSWDDDDDDDDFDDDDYEDDEDEDEDDFDDDEDDEDDDYEDEDEDDFVSTEYDGNDDFDEEYDEDDFDEEEDGDEDDDEFDEDEDEDEDYDDEEDEDEDEDEDDLDDDYGYDDDEDEDDDSRFGRSAGAGRIEPRFGSEQGFSEAELENGRFSAEAGQAASRESAAARAPAGGDSQGELPLEAARGESGEGAGEALGDPEEVIVINVMARRGESFSGKDMLAVIMKQGLRLGDMSIFHRHADSSGNGPVIFSMANMVKPGTFDIRRMEEFATPGVSLFQQLPGPISNMKNFDKMLATATAIRDALGGELKDEHRSVLTRQTIEHYRQRIRDFELRQLARK